MKNFFSYITCLRFCGDSVHTSHTHLPVLYVTHTWLHTGRARLEPGQRTRARERAETLHVCATDVEKVSRVIKKRAPRDSRRAAGCGMAACPAACSLLPAPASRRGARAVHRVHPAGATAHARGHESRHTTRTKGSLEGRAARAGPTPRTRHSGKPAPGRTNLEERAVRTTLPPPFRLTHALNGPSTSITNQTAHAGSRRKLSSWSEQERPHP